MFLKNFKSIFSFKPQIFCLLRNSVGAQTRNYLGNTEETLTLDVSRMFPRLHILKTQNLGLGSKKCFASFPFVHPCNIVSNIDSECFCSNVSWFAPAFKLLVLN